MTTLSTAQRRRWAHDLLANNQDNPIAHAHVAQMLAECDLDDAKSGIDSGIADIAEITQDIPLIGKVTIRGGKIVAVERHYNGEGEAHGIHCAWEWRSDPAAEYYTGMCVRMYIGTEQSGPLAQWEASTGQWYALESRGNYGKRYAFGGNFKGTKISQKPGILQKLEDIMDRAEKIRVAEIKLKAAQKRVFAAHQLDGVRAYERQASNPAYDGQDMVCMGKAAVVRALAAQTMAEADLIEAGI